MPRKRESKRGRPRTRTEGDVVTRLRIPWSLHAQLAERAKIEQRSLAFLIRQAIGRMLAS